MSYKLLISGSDFILISGSDILLSRLPMLSKGRYVALPLDDEDLSIEYAAQDVIDVSLDDEQRVAQISYGDYAIHQFKSTIKGAKATIKCNVRSSIAGDESPIYLQIYNKDLSSWETIDSDIITGADTDFNLEAVVADLTDYKDGDDEVSCRVWQEAI